MVTIKYENEEKSYFSLGEAAEALGVRPQVLSNWLGGRAWSFRKRGIVEIREWYHNSDRVREVKLEDMYKK